MESDKAIQVLPEKISKIGDSLIAVPVRGTVVSADKIATSGEMPISRSLKMCQNRAIFQLSIAQHPLYNLQNYWLVNMMIRGLNNQIHFK